MASSKYHILFFILISLFLIYTKIVSSADILPIAVQTLNYSSALSDNKDLCGPPSLTPCPSNDTSETTPSPPKSSNTTQFGDILVAINLIVLFFLVLLFVIYLKKLRELNRQVKESLGVNKELDVEENVEALRRDRHHKKFVEVEVKEKLVFMEGVASFELSNLLKASAEGLGKGNFGSCYKALLEDGRAVAVKRLRDLRPLSNDEFVKQLQSISNQKHQNLLPLLAYYYSKDERLLVHKFAHNGNIYNRLHGGRGTKDRIPFRWSSRLSVARGVARALEYLHLNTRSQSIVPHGNLKSSNVLLDDNEMVLVSDYGLTSLISLPIAAQRMVSYKSPEYQSSKKISKKSDVWSYGCLLLELLTGRVSAHSSMHGNDGVDLGSWVHRAVREEWTAEIFDLEISMQRSASHGMLRMLQLAVRCCDKSPEKRPEMSEIVREVENVKIAVDSDDEDILSDRSMSDKSMSTTASL